MTWTNDRNERIDFPFFFFFHPPLITFQTNSMTCSCSAYFSLSAIRSSASMFFDEKRLQISIASFPPPPSSSTNFLTYDVAHRPSRYQYILLHTLPTTTYHTYVLLINSIPPLSLPVPLCAPFLLAWGSISKIIPLAGTNVGRGCDRSHPSLFCLSIYLTGGSMGLVDGSLGEWMDRQTSRSQLFVIPYLPSVFPIPLVYFWPH